MFCITLLSALTFTLLLAIVPIDGAGGFQLQLVKSPLFFGLNILLVVVLLVYCLRRIKRSPLLALTHFALILTILCGFFYAQYRIETEPFRLNFSIPSYRIASAYIQSNTPRQEPVLTEFGFSVACDSFFVERYEPDFDHVRVERLLMEKGMGRPTQKVTALGTYSLEAVSEKFALKKSDLYHPDSTLKKYIQMGTNEGLALNQKDKNYLATLTISNEDKPFYLRPNAPVSYKNWQFFLLDYDAQNIIVCAVNDPMRIPFTIALYLLMFSLMGVCFKSFYRHLRG